MKELRDKLLEERMRAWTGMNQMLDELRDDTGAFTRDMTAEEQQEFSRRNAELDDFDRRIGELNKRIESDANVDEYRSDAQKRLFEAAGKEERVDYNTEIERRAGEFFSADPDDRNAPRVLEVNMKGLQVFKDSRGMPYVVDTLAEAEQRAGLVKGTSSAGGYTVPTSFRAVLYAHLIQNSAIRQTRATILTTDSGEALQLPKTTAHPADGTIVAEGAIIAEADPTFGQGTLNAYKFGNLIQLSNELETDTAVDLLGYVAMAVGRALANGMGSKFIKGTGSSEPQGILVGNGTVAQTAGGTGQSGIPTYKELEAIFDSIIPAYQVNGEWLFNQTTVSKLRQITDNYGRPLWVPSLSGGMPDMLFGKPYYIDPYMPSAGTSSTSILFGDFAPYFIRDVAGLRFERSVDYAFANDLVTYRALWRADGVLLDTTGALGTYKGGTS